MWFRPLLEPDQDRCCSCRLDPDVVRDAGGDWFAGGENGRAPTRRRRYLDGMSTEYLIERPRLESIIGGFYAVYNYYGYGLPESAYAGALEHELRDRGHGVDRELAVRIDYQGRPVCWIRLDFVVDQRIVIEIKATEKLSPHAERQLFNYLRATSFEVGLLLHFGPQPRFYKHVDTLKREPRAPGTTPTRSGRG